MKKLLLSIAALAATFTLANAQTTYTIDVEPLSFAYSPPLRAISKGDKIQFTASDFHPLQQVSQATWDANGDTPLPGGFYCNSTCTVPFDSVGEFYFVCTRHTGGTTPMKGKVIVAAPLSVKTEMASAYGIRLFPNPASSQMELRLGQATMIQSISVTNSLGHPVLNLPINGAISNYTLNVSELESGIYHVLISTPDKRMMEKIVIE